MWSGIIYECFCFYLGMIHTKRATHTFIEKCDRNVNIWKQKVLNEKASYRREQETLRLLSIRSRNSFQYPSPSTLFIKNCKEGIYIFLFKLKIFGIWFSDHFLSTENILKLFRAHPLSQVEISLKSTTEGVCWVLSSFEK